MTIPHIIIADDHTLIRIGLMTVLKNKFPYATIKEVEDGDSLLKEVSLHKWDLVISDLNMPGPVGLKLLEQIKLIKPDLPVLIVSVCKDDEYAVRVLNSGGSGYINKTAATEELNIAVKQILGGKKYFSPEIAGKLLDHAVGNKKPHELLTNMEFEVFMQFAFSKTASQVAKELIVTSSAIASCRRRIMQKMFFLTNADLVEYATANQLIPAG